MTLILNDSIVIASDSRHFVENTLIPNSVDTVCKIGCKKKIAYAIAGNADISYNYKKVFNAYTILSNIISETTSLAKMKERLDIDLNKNLKSALKIIDTSALRKVLNLPFIEIVITKYENNKPVAIIINYSLNGSCVKNAKLQGSVEPNAPIPFLHKTGFYQKINTFLDNNPKYLIDITTIKEKVVHLICLETTGTQKVGLPFDILVLKPNGVFYKMRVYKCN